MYNGRNSLHVPGYNAGNGLAGLHDFHLSIEHQMEGKDLAERGRRDEGSCMGERRVPAIRLAISQINRESACLAITFAEKLHFIVGRLLILLGVLLRLGCHIDFPYHKLHMVIALDVVALVLQQPQALLLLIAAIAIEAILCAHRAHCAHCALRCGRQLVRSCEAKKIFN